MTTVLLTVAGIVFVLVALLMVVAILLQESKGGGLAALGGTRAESAFGASNPLRKMTVVLSIIFFLLAGGLSLALRPAKSAFKADQTKPKPTKVEKPETGAGAGDIEKKPEAPADEGKAPAEAPPAGKGDDGASKAPQAPEAPKDAPVSEKEAGKPAAKETAPATVPAPTK